MGMVQKVRDEIRDMRRSAALAVEPYVPSQSPIKLTEEQWETFLEDEYLRTLHSEEGIELIAANKQYLGHPIEIKEE